MCSVLIFRYLLLICAWQPLSLVQTPYTTQVTLGPPQPPTPESPTTTTTAVALPLHPPAEPAITPDWFSAATTQLQTAPASKEWLHLVTTWIKFEERFVYFFLPSLAIINSTFSIGLTNVRRPSRSEFLGRYQWQVRNAATTLPHLIQNLHYMCVLEQFLAFSCTCTRCQCIIS
jgi:hypothetical protein